jgi:hypothetical protein
VIAVAMNLVFLISMLLKGYPLQLFSVLAVVVGLYIAISQWRLLRILRDARAVLR